MQRTLQRMQRGRVKPGGERSRVAVVEGPRGGGGADRRPQNHAGNQVIQRALRPVIRAKLTVGSARDPAEEEADRVADEVMRAPAGAGGGVPPASPSISEEPSDESAQRKCACGGEGECEECRERERGQEAVHLKSKAGAGGAAMGRPAPAAVGDTLRTPGEPLGRSAREFMESRFGRDFGDVRVHADAGAASSADQIHARAYASGRHVVFAANQYQPDTESGRRLLGHELTHVVQQGAAPARLGETGGGAAVSRHGSSRRMVRREISQVDTTIYISILFPDVSVGYEIQVDDATAQFYAAYPDKLQQLHDQLQRLYLPPSGRLQEGTTFLSSERVRNLIRQDVRESAQTGQVQLRRLNEFLVERQSALRGQRLIGAVENWLAANAGIAAGTIDWRHTTAVLQGRLPAVQDPAATAMRASEESRYAIFLTMLRNEAAAAPSPPNVGLPPDVAGLESRLREYSRLHLPAAVTAGTTAVHGESFLEEWIDDIEQIRFVPAGFSLDPFVPRDSEEQFRTERERILGPLIREAPDLVQMFILDDWTRSGADPRVWLETLNVESYRERVLDYLANVFFNRARADPALVAALRVHAVEQARFRTVTVLYWMARVKDSDHDGLRQRLESVPLEDLDDQDRMIANDPAGYLVTATKLAAATQRLLSSVRPGADISEDVLRWAADSLAALDVSQQLAGVFLLPQFLFYLKQMQDLAQEQRRKALEAIREAVAVDFDRIKGVMEQRGRLADEFIKYEWLPMLKRIALERVEENHKELKRRLEEWGPGNQEAIRKLEEGAAEFDALAAGLEDGTYESISMGDEDVTAANANKLRDAATVLRDQARVRRNPWDRFKKMKEIEEALDVFESVKEDIRDDEYDPLDYSPSVYVEARARLGIAEFPEYTTTGMVLHGHVSADKNPFLARAIVFWRWSEQTERSIGTLLMVAGLFALTLASILVPGVAGLVIGAVDVAIGLGMGIKGLADAYETLDMARLDIYGDIRGITVEQARSAVTYAWIGLGVSVVLTAGPAAFSRALRIRGRSGDLPTDFVRWERTLSAESKVALRGDTKLQRLFADMPEDVRKILTLCNTPCIPTNPPPSLANIQRIQQLMKDLNLPANHRGLREYLHVNRKNLTGAIKELDGVTTTAQLELRFQATIMERAKRFGGSAALGPDGLWEFSKGTLLVREHSIGPYKTLSEGKKGSGSFFQAHHGIQGTWGKARVPGYDYDLGPTINLRDSRLGTPHQIVTSRQAARGSGRNSRTYSQERKNLLGDMEAAGVPSSTAQRLLDDSDAYFTQLYKRLESKKVKAEKMRSIFGDWKPSS